MVLATTRNLIWADETMENYTSYKVNFTINSSVQSTVNPGANMNISFVTTVTVSGLNDTLNISVLRFYLPDNYTTSEVTDFKLYNASNSQMNASAFVSGDYNYVNFTDLDLILNDTANASTFNITWMLNEPIDIAKISVSSAGRAYTETYNITTLTSNLTIINASLNVTPSFWYTRIGTPTTVQFNNTGKGYTTTISGISVFTDLNLTNNLRVYGSGWETLSIIYNGPTVDSSSGKSPSEVAPISIIPSRILDWFTPTVILFSIVGLILIATVVVVIVVLVKR